MVSQIIPCPIDKENCIRFPTFGLIKVHQLDRGDLWRVEFHERTRSPAFGSGEQGAYRVLRGRERGESASESDKVGTGLAPGADSTRYANCLPALTRDGHQTCHRPFSGIL